MRRVREHLPTAALGSTLWWLAEHVLDKGVEHAVGTVMHFIGHLPL
ncbi:MAG: hypothetical protein KGJ49_04980 [Alphaproteobacteria bacterium]|nr:hypothetical protein [Alphaproteobacteria bacterium]